MPIFVCSQCLCMENTAVSEYFFQVTRKPPQEPLCSECNPRIGQWHGRFEKKSAVGFIEASDHFLYGPAAFEPGGELQWRIDNQGLRPVFRITPNGKERIDTGSDASPNADGGEAAAGAHGAVRLHARSDGSDRGVAGSGAIPAPAPYPEMAGDDDDE